MQVFRLFLSSPKDASVERRRTERVVGRLNGEFRNVAKLETVRWESEHYQAHATFQSQIPPATECDLVVGILKWRLGTELPPDFERTADGEAYPSGTAYEILTSIEKRRGGSDLPDVFVFRFKGSAPTLSLDDPNRERIESEWTRLKGFFERWFITKEGHFLAAMNNYASEDDFEAQLETLLRKWLAEKVAGGKVVRWPAAKGSPFRGLSVFGAKHAPVFFGRSSDIRKASDLWRDYAARGERYLLIVGASGAGKSSLARSGLVPRIMTPGVVANVDLWRVAVMRPGDSADGPLASLATALMQTENDLPPEEEGRGPALPEIAEGDSKTPEELAAVLAHGEASAVRPVVNALARVGDRAKDTERYGRDVRCDLVLLVDQLDELFAPSVTQEIRDRFADLLKSLVASGRVWVLATLRADLYQSMLEVPALKALKDAGASYDLAPPGIAELAEIVREPAKAADLTFETDAKTGQSLDERLLSEADRPDMLPLVQLALSRLWEKRITQNSDTLLTHAAFDTLGGVKGIIEEAGEGALTKLGATERSGLPTLIRKLAELSPVRGGATTYTARAVPLAEAASTPAAKALVEALVDARLLTLSGSGNDTTVRLSHQRVLSDWPRATQIVAASATFYRVRDEVEAQRRRWEAGKRRRELLLPRGLPLAEARDIASAYDAELSPETHSYIKTSRRRANLLQTGAFAAAAVLAVVAIGAGIEAKVAADSRRDAVEASLRADRHAKEEQNQKGIAERERKLALASAAEASTQRDEALKTQSRFLSDIAQRANDEGAPTPATLVALEALPDPSSDLRRPYVSDAEVSLYNAYRTIDELAVLGDAASGLIKVEICPHSNKLLTASKDGQARVYDSASGKLLRILRGHTGEVSDIACSPDGKTIATAARDRTAALWEADTGQRIAILPHADIVTSVRFSPENDGVLTASSDNTAALWDMHGQMLRRFESSFDGLSSAIFSPDGQTIATFSDDNTAVLWNRANGALLITLDGHTGRVKSGAFSPDSKSLATWSEDKTLRVWDVDSGKTLAILKGAGEGITKALFSSDGRRLYAGWHNGLVRVWDATSYKVVGVLGDNKSNVFDFALDKSGQTVAIAFANGRTTIWDAIRMAHVKTYGGHGSVTSVTFTDDGSNFASGSADGTASIWALPKSPVRAEITDEVTAFKKYPKKDEVIIGTARGAVTVSDLSTGKTILAMGQAGQDSIARFDVSLDGRFLAATSKSFVYMWNLQNGKLIRRLEGFGAAMQLNCVTFSRDGRRLAAGGLGFGAIVWDTETGGVVRKIENPEKMFLALDIAFTNNGSQLLITGGKLHNPTLTNSTQGLAFVWDVDQGKLRRKLVGSAAPEGWYRLGAFGSDQRIITVTLNGRGDIWSADSDQLPAETFSSPQGGAMASYSPELGYISLHDGTLAQYDASKHAVRTIVDEDDLDFMSQEGTNIYGVSKKGNLHTYKLYQRTEDLVAEVRKHAIRCLAPSERSSYALEAKPPAWCVENSLWPYNAPEWKQWQALDVSNKHPAFPDERGMLSVRVSDPDVKIIELKSGAAGDRAGLKVGDTILSVNGEPTKGTAEFVRQVSWCGSGKRISLKVNRDRESHTLTAILDPMPSMKALGDAGGAPAKMELDNPNRPPDALDDISEDDAKVEAAKFPPLIQESSSLFNAGAYKEAMLIAEKLKRREMLLALKLRPFKARRETMENVIEAEALNSVSWYAIFARDYKKAISASERAVSLSPESISFNANLAHALAFDGKQEQALAIYREFKGKKMPDGSSWADLIRADLTALHAAGLDNPLRQQLVEAHLID